MTLRAFLTAAILALGLLPGPARAGEVLVFAAASLGSVLGEIEAGFTAATGHRAVHSFAGSSALARQIAQGAPAGVFLSANPGWMDELEARGLLADGSRRDLLGNTLVLIAHDPATPRAEPGPGLDLADLLGRGPLAMALVEAVPAGIYGKAALEALGLWRGVADRVAQADNVRAALALVAAGAAPLGIVYGSDALAEPRVHVVGTFPAAAHPPITYTAAVIAAKDTPAARAYLAYLQEPESQRLFAAHGFTAPVR